MFTSPCKICLVFPACSSLCTKKISFTAERFCRLLRYRKITAEKGIQDQLTIDLMKEIWEENTKIGTRANTDPNYGGAQKYNDVRDKILEILRIEHPYRNTKYCHALMKHYNIERKDYADKV